mmetsp:Transcript_30925/g.87574  ORF Transcript_30925/g.87574 Transcript_30925/m.87574 type:complete len:279 (-) Transcript_30925:534-1370(-)
MISGLHQLGMPPEDGWLGRRPLLNGGGLLGGGLLGGGLLGGGFLGGGLGCGDGELGVGSPVTSRSQPMKGLISVYTAGVPSSPQPPTLPNDVMPTRTSGLPGINIGPPESPTHESRPLPPAQNISSLMKGPKRFGLLQVFRSNTSTSANMRSSARVPDSVSPQPTISRLPSQESMSTGLSGISRMGYPLARRSSSIKAMSKPSLKSPSHCGCFVTEALVNTSTWLLGCWASERCLRPRCTSGLSSPSSMQWAAVTTNLSWISAAPQKWRPDARRQGAC